MGSRDYKIQIGGVRYMRAGVVALNFATDNFHGKYELQTPTSPNTCFWMNEQCKSEGAFPPALFKMDVQSYDFSLLHTRYHSYYSTYQGLLKNNHNSLHTSPGGDCTAVRHEVHPVAACSHPPDSLQSTGRSHILHSSALDDSCEIDLVLECIGSRTP